MLVSLPTAYICLAPSDFKNFSQSLVAVSTFSSNIFFWRTSGYWDTASELKPLLHTWSLAVEEQYYVLFPIFLILMHRYRKRWMLSLFVLIAAISLSIGQWGSHYAPIPAFFLLPSRGWEIAIGAGIAFYFVYCKHNIITTIFLHKYIYEILGLFGLLMIFYGVFVFDKTTPFPSFYALIPTVGTGLIILCSSPQTIVGRLLGSKLLVAVGLISYSVYLWHQPLFAFTRYISIDEPSDLTYAILAFLLFPIGYLSWRYVEQPFRHKDAINSKKVLLFAVGGSIFFISIGFIGHKTNGFFELKTNKYQKSALLTASPSPKRDECHTDGPNYRKPKNACKYHSQNPTWAVLGDSHAVEIAYALADLLKESNDGVIHFSYSSCRPRPKQTPAKQGCNSWTYEVVDYILSDSVVKNIVVSYMDRSIPSGKNADEESNKVWKAYIQILKRFLDAGKNVFIVLQYPEPHIDVRRLIMRENKPINIKGDDANWWKKRSELISHRLNSILNGLNIINPAQLLCDTQYCYVVKNGLSLFFDIHHLSVDGAKIIAKEILKQEKNNNK